MYETQTPICVKRFIFTQGSEQSTGQTSGRQPSEEANTEYSGIIKQRARIKNNEFWPCPPYTSSIKLSMHVTLQIIPEILNVKI